MLCQTENIWTTSVIRNKCIISDKTLSGTCINQFYSLPLHFQPCITQTLATLQTQPSSPGDKTSHDRKRVGMFIFVRMALCASWHFLRCNRVKKDTSLTWEGGGVGELSSGGPTLKQKQSSGGGEYCPVDRVMLGSRPYTQNWTYLRNGEPLRLVTLMLVVIGHWWGLSKVCLSLSQVNQHLHQLPVLESNFFFF